MNFGYFHQSSQLVSVSWTYPRSSQAHEACLGPRVIIAMSKPTTRRSRHKVLPEELPLTAPTGSKSLHLVPVVNSTPHQGTKSPIEPQKESATSLGPAPPEPPNVMTSSGSGRIPHVSLNSPKSLSAILPTCPTEAVPTTLVEPTGSSASRKAAAEARIEQEEIDFIAVAGSTDAEISRLHNLEAEQKSILARVREKKDENIEKARGIIEGNDEIPLETAS